MGIRIASVGMACLLMVAGPLRAESSGTPTGALKTAPDAVELEPMTVVPQINPMDESMERLRAMMEDTPCLGCGPEQEAARANPYGWMGALVTALTGLGVDPPTLTPGQRAEDRLRTEWRVAERGPDMDAFR